MSCCVPAAVFYEAESGNLNQEVLLASRPLNGGLRQNDLSVPGIHCGGCLEAIERTLSRLDGVAYVRANLSTKRVSVHWRGDSPPPFISALQAIGYPTHIHDFSTDNIDPMLSRLLRALAVAGFATSNIMILSVSIWSGAETDTRYLFHWISALIALPALAFSGQIFFRSAWRSLRAGRTNMDVPISIGVLLAFGMSLYETINHGEHAYFDAAVSLLFFLLIGRTLDYVMRERARIAVKGLARLSPRGALVVQADGIQIYRPTGEIRPGMTILLAAGERVPVDARVVSGMSDIGAAIVTGESAPRPVSAGVTLQAGTLNLTGPLTIVATAAARDSFLAEMTRMMETAESSRTGYRRIADRAAALYAPLIHLTALLTLIGWFSATGDLHRAITIAIAVLIITCPCALGLAVPMVQVVAAKRLFENGILLNDGTALERLSEVDWVIFDKTGTLTTGQPRLVDEPSITPEVLGLAAAIASHSRHPYSRALSTAGADCLARLPSPDAVFEHPGCGLEYREGETVYRLGRPDWAYKEPKIERSESGIVLTANGQQLATFRFTDELRRDANAAVATLKCHHGFGVEIVSGDGNETVKRLAMRLGVPARAQALPADKVKLIKILTMTGHKVLMVGDGINDAPALTAAHASMAPASAIDVGRNAADLVFLRESLTAVPVALALARASRRLIRQNLALAIAYNAVAVPIAISGAVTPLIAAVAMSGSSIIVVANALRLRVGSKTSGLENGLAPQAAKPTAYPEPTQ